MEFQELKSLIIVTGVSSNHFDEVKFMLSTAKQNLNAKVYLYDLGLEEEQLLEANKYCNVTVST